MLKIAIFIFVLLVLFFSTWFLFLNKENVKKVSKGGPVVFFGDSLTAGVGAGPEEDFPSQVAKQLNLTNVVNAGVSGDTTDRALTRLQTDVLDKNPSLVVVLLGGNDFLLKIPSDTTIDNLDQIVREISETDSAVILVHTATNPIVDKYKSPLSNIAKEYEAVFIPDILKGIVGRDELMSDPIHPNAKGYKIMADRIVPAVKMILE